VSSEAHVVTDGSVMASLGGLDRARVAELIVTHPGGRRRGSGYRVTANAVLTAAHVLADASDVRVRFGRTGGAVGVLARHHPGDGLTRLAAARLGLALDGLDTDRQAESRPLLPTLPQRSEQLHDVVPPHQDG
jgi:hypothetical protein